MSKTFVMNANIFIINFLFYLLLLSLLIATLLFNMFSYPFNVLLLCFIEYFVLLFFQIHLTLLTKTYYRFCFKDFFFQHVIPLPHQIQVTLSIEIVLLLFSNFLDNIYSHFHLMLSILLSYNVLFILLFIYLVLPLLYLSE